MYPLCFSDEFLESLYDLGELLLDDLQEVVDVDLLDVGIHDELDQLVDGLVVEGGQLLLRHEVPVELVLHPVAPHLVVGLEGLSKKDV